jgi:hypothetical protein
VALSLFGGRVGLRVLPAGLVRWRLLSKKKLREGKKDWWYYSDLCS